ncbi:midasin [Ipomoea triloba]|uniref:midasin n=1 Tax=Ipomoea triloba TaxID=35885 RepID=UPI00125DC392|nr:midasin [Ipomoea triloba]
MSLDGSFHLEFEFERFVSRRPGLAKLPLFLYLLKKGDKVSEEEVVNALGQLILHPSYTVPLVGCFRPIARKIVDKSVELLRLVPNLRSNNDDLMTDFDEDRFLREAESQDHADVTHVVDVYVRNGKGLSLHELACLAFCRALDLVPRLKESILSYFSFAPPPFERINQRGPYVDEAAMEGTCLLDIVRVSYRFLLAACEFTTLWNWSCFLNLSVCNNEELKSSISDIGWYRKQILSVVLNLSSNTSLSSEEEFSCLLRWQEFCQDVSLEKAGWYIECSKEKDGESSGEVIGFDQGYSVPSTFGSLNSPSAAMHKSLQSTESTRGNGKPFTITSAVKKSYEMVFLAVSQRWPVLLYGPAGAGKTALVARLAQEYGSQVLSIHMDEQIDGRTLVGSYVCADQPGEFRWQPGSLTQAVSNGLWVVIEDVDKAPPDVRSVLLPLLEGSNSFSTGHGEVISVNEDFRLFSTVTSSKLDISAEGNNSVSAFWRRIMVGPPSEDDLLNIVNAWYPKLNTLAGKLIETFKIVNALSASQLGSVTVERFSLRDLLKWCKRIAGQDFFWHQDGLSSYARDAIFKEALDVFAAFSTSMNRDAIRDAIAKLWSVETLCPINKPKFQIISQERNRCLTLNVGRVSLECCRKNFCHEDRPFVQIRNSLHVLERIACSVKYNEPVLLVGETGTGKTTLVQSLATRLGKKLTVLNLSQQSDIADLLGGFKPVDARFVCFPLYKEFENLFTKTFSLKDNEGFLKRLGKFLEDRNWKKLLVGFQKGVEIIGIGRSGSGMKRKRPLGEEVKKEWENFSIKLEKARAQTSASAGMIFSFVEGAFVTALKNGDWILLDEVNLAPPETLQRVIGVLEEENGSLCLTEKGDVNCIDRNSSFRIFACMNPATDAGKRDLPFSLRSRFSEYFVDDVMDDDDLTLFVNNFIDEDHSNTELVRNIVLFYKAAKNKSEESLQDGANQKPQYSLRSLRRALDYFKKAKRHFGYEKALYDGFCMFFLILLDETSAKLMNNLISSHLLGGKLPQQIPFDAYLINKRTRASVHDDLLDSYVLTKTVKEHLKNLARAIFIGSYPVLLQGPTSSGKTSLVQYLAAVTGHEFVRINNHEHTDLQEYLGSYITDASGKLVFHEGALVRAVRNGHWIVLDELNLAPSDVLEALNRLLDDFRELYVPELRETVRVHPEFMLFATQNPPTFYGGRKMLSRAFRNRFVEIHVDEIPEDELSTILENKCTIPPRYAKVMVDVMKELQLRRQSSKVFAGKHGFITPRDLFRWANRFKVFGKTYEDLARDGYYLLAERLRDDNERSVVQEVLERKLKVKLSENFLYKQEEGYGENFEVGKNPKLSEHFGGIVLTKSMQRLYFLVERCYKLREPVLLVGETGGGKTTICQFLSIILASELHILNCHQFTETSDFLGGFYPVRERSRISMDFKDICEKLMCSKPFVHFPGGSKIPSDINQASKTLEKISKIVSSYNQGLVSHPDVTAQELDYIKELNLELVELHQQWQMIFRWKDGPLVEAMKRGDLFLVDEISLADDSVLERLNSVLEPERKLSLAEKGGSDLEMVTAHSDFCLFATMNPGGDFGKKELSPALRNRFTEIWVPPVSGLDELKLIALRRIINPQLGSFVDPMLKFWEWFNNLKTGRMLTVRDLLSWVSFINTTGTRLQPESLLPESAFLHGAFLVLLDGLNLGTNISKYEAAGLRKKCFLFLLGLLKEINSNFDCSSLATLENYGWSDSVADAVVCTDNKQCDTHFGIHPFYIERGKDNVPAEKFDFLAPTTHRNALRVLRAMQLSKPVLLEGSPGVGKTSLVVALGKFSGHTVVRVNLSEQTDIMDLLGSDLPVESDEGMQFAWSDGILLQALKKGSWVLLDELNLAPQSVLEGLNAILDHRAEVFIPELGVTFKCPTSFRVFACQNPSSQGGGRKNLPKSFLNRFTKVYVDELVQDDYLAICSSLYPSISRSILSNLVLFNKRLHEETMVFHKFGHEGSPWEFNLRDVIRSCEIMMGQYGKTKFDCFLNTVYLQRMRTSSDRQEVMKLYEAVFQMKPSINPYPRVQLDPQWCTVGNVSLQRVHHKSSYHELKVLPCLRNSLEAAAHCVKHKWLCILVGPQSSGKTSLIRILAQLTGNLLNELNLSSATDISELLGSFEQYNAIRKYRLAISQVEDCVNEYCRLQQLESLPEASMRRDDLIVLWLAFVTSIDCVPSKKYIESIPLLVNIIEHLKSDIVTCSLRLSWSVKDLDATLTAVRKCNDHLRRHYAAKFEWVPGILIKAIENGEWIVLQNANLCNPTVLDRINSLVEQSGSITINECGTVDGKPVILHPHPRFRMFLTVNPAHGEVSRAMRNRGVEVYMMEPNWLFDIDSKELLDVTEHKDAMRFLVLSGIPVGKLVDMMARAHIYAKNEGARYNMNITLLELSRWVQLFQELLTQGNKLSWSLQISWEHIYLSSLGEGEGRDIVDNARQSHLSVAEYQKFHSLEDWMLRWPGGWPTPLKLRDIIYYSEESCVKQNCMYLEFLGSQTACNSSLQQTLRACRSVGCQIFDLKSLHKVMFPLASEHLDAHDCGKKDFNQPLVKKMQQFAASWVLEQATTESDFKLYLKYFSQLGSVLQEHGSFLNRFVYLLRNERERPIWNLIFKLHQEIMPQKSIEVKLNPKDLLSEELVDVAGPECALNSCCEQLKSATRSVRLLILSNQQWSYEKGYASSNPDTKILERVLRLEPVLRSLQQFEDKVLQLFGSEEFMKSPNSEVLLSLYSDLLEHHCLFWNSVVSPQVEFPDTGMLISWRSLTKDVTNLEKTFREKFPNEVENLKSKMLTIDEDPRWSDHLQKPLLWDHGGHPFQPSTAELYQKRCQLLKKCEELVLPQRRKGSELGGNNVSIEAAALSSNPELRFLAMEGVCMSSYVMEKSDGDHLNVVNQLGDMCQMLSRRIDFEKKKLEENPSSLREEVLLSNSSACCVFTPNLLSLKSGIACWLETLPLADDISFILDTRLLQHFSNLDQLHELTALSGRIESTMNFSLNFSSRPPTDFLGHQKILWTLDAWGSVCGVSEKISSFILDIWFAWHSALWSPCHAVTENNPLEGFKDDLPPDRLFKPVKMAAVEQILQGIFAVRDYSLHSLKLRASSHHLWHGSTDACITEFLLSTARFLFQQIVSAHQSSFEDDKYNKIKSLFPHNSREMLTENDVGYMISLLTSSKHEHFESLISPLIKPLLRALYLPCSSSDFMRNLGSAWLLIGRLRYCLLTSYTYLDPTVKYTVKLSQLTEKIASLQLENEVRRECTYLSGSFELREDDRHTKVLEELNTKLKKLQKQIVYRLYPGNFKNLKDECDVFLRVVQKFASLITDAKSMHSEERSGQLRNWQETSSSFIERLSNEYADYIDIVQPIQISVYEMKLGLSLVFSSALGRKLVEELGKQEMDSVLGSIYSFMRFPGGCAPKFASVKGDSTQYKLSWNDIELPTNVNSMDLHLLENLVTSKNDGITDGMVSASLYHNILVRVMHSAADARFMDNSSFTLLEKIFDNFSRRWMDMKLHLRMKEENNDQLVTFRSRALKIENIIDSDISNLESAVSNENFSDWKEMFSGDELSDSAKTNTECDTPEDDWNSVEESIINDMINIHNQIFGSTDLVENPGNIHVFDADRFSTFIESYSLGVRMTKDLDGLLCSWLDAKVVPEHLLRLCLEHEHMVISPRKSAHAYNFYKDSNAPTMATMVDPVTSLKEKILMLLNEWDDHPALQKIVEVIDMILAIPLSAPLAKALSGLHFLINRVHMLCQTVAKFPLSDQMKPIFALVSSWHKLEFESWPALLDEVQSQFEINAAKLWFPLYSVLQPSNAYTPDMIKSLEEFLQMSCIGEFRRRLQLLVAFHGHFSNCISRDSQSSHEKIVEVLYNSFGYYVQFLPKILDHMDVSRKNVEKELKDLVKLCRWERVEDYTAIESFRRTRQKLKKLIQKFTDLFQQSVMFFINQEVTGSSINCQTVEDTQFSVGFYDKSRNILNALCEQIQFIKDSSPYVAVWWKEVESVSHDFHFSKTTEVDFSDISCQRNLEEVGRILKDGLPSQCSQISCFGDWNQLWHTIDEICRTVIGCAEIWKDDGKKFGRRRVFSDLLKVLEACGLFKHRSTFKTGQGEANASICWLLQPSYEVPHLLLTKTGLSSGNVENHILGELQGSSSEDLNSEWKSANQYYFKSIKSMKLLQSISLNFHKDFTLEQVERSGSFIDHLLTIQQEQRGDVYDFARQLRHFKECRLPLVNMFSCSFPFASTENTDLCLAQNQYKSFTCLWQQKQLFDSLCVLLHEERLFLQTVVDNHLSTCTSVKHSAMKILLFIGKYFPNIQKTKNLLDDVLLGVDRVTTTTRGGTPLHPCGITEHLEKMLNQNFELIKTFENDLHTFRGQNVDGAAVEDTLLGHFSDIFDKANFMASQFSPGYGSSENEVDSDCHLENITEVEVQFGLSLMETCKCIMHALHAMGSLGNDLPDKLNINMWKALLQSNIAKLQLDVISDRLLETVCLAGKILYIYDRRNPRLSSLIKTHLKHLYSLSNAILAFGEGLLHHFLVMHRMVCVMTHVLAEVFGLLFSKGFGTKEDQINESSQDETRDASGTGMGDGTGCNDVSDQITDEDQLLEPSKEPNEQQNSLGDMSNVKDKGIEMEEDFAADTYSVSEDSVDDGDGNEENEQVESAVGETGNQSEKVDEKLWDREEDENNDSVDEKYEPGQAVKDKGDERELQAKDDSAAIDDEKEGADPGALGKQPDENGNEESLNETEDMDLEEQDACTDPTGLKLDEPDQGPENDGALDPSEGTDLMDEDDNNVDLSTKSENEEPTDPMDETLEEMDHKRLDEESGEVQEDSDHESNMNKEPLEPRKDAVQPKASHVAGQSEQNGQSALDLPEPRDDGGPENLENSMEEAEWSNRGGLEHNLAPGGGSNADQDIMVAGSSMGDKLSGNRPETPFPLVNSSINKNQPNPCRNVGDALDGWKERVKISVDLEDNIQSTDDLVDMDAEEYGYTVEFDKGTAQAIGPAMTDQVDRNASGNDVEENAGTDEKKDYASEMELDKLQLQPQPIVSSASNFSNDIEMQLEKLETEKQIEPSAQEDKGYDDGPSSSSLNLVSVKRNYLSEDINQVSNLSVNDENLGKAWNLEGTTGDLNVAAALWKRYELLTTRLSQELAEQLRLIMEPTLASKLQGDYRTGKRINMKKVIPYIASHYRKDKIWLRRTRPNKRDYQVVIAVDDSRSMSESHCGHIAIEALVTVCRAMSQLEVGKLAVASFGEEGNIQLLHDFDQQFSGDAGIKMISSFTFMQENTIAHKPMVDLLKYLNDMLDAASRLPTGDNPLQQLVLIIADGRFHEKEKLKPRVRDLLNKKRLVVFLVLDSPEVPIMDIQDVDYDFKEGSVKLSKYMESFPFPYYLVLRNIESLPRTLADLLRQWFELMRSSRD